jgi:hypothetical protein
MKRIKPIQVKNNININPPARITVKASQLIGALLNMDKEICATSAWMQKMIKLKANKANILVLKISQRVMGFDIKNSDVWSFSSFEMIVASVDVV